MSKNAVEHAEQHGIRRATPEPRCFVDRIDDLAVPRPGRLMKARVAGTARR